MYIVTFYSYRGGVGRTTALVNVAASLARRGRRVLLVDFDLESPGFPSFPKLCPKKPRPGLVEFVSEYLRHNQAPALEDYCYEAPLLRDDRGLIWVMPAGRGDDDYWGALADLDWNLLYEARDGFLLFEDLKLQWQESSLKPDYVLIDTHAGITAMTGICTRQLADAVVAMITPDQLKDRTAFERVLTDVAAEGGDEQDAKRIAIHLVASKVPDPDDFQVSLEPPGCGILDMDAAIPLARSLVKSSRLPVVQNPRSRVAREFRRLASTLIRWNSMWDSEGALAFFVPSNRVPQERILEHILKNFANDPKVMSQAADLLFRADRIEKAMQSLGDAVGANPTDPDLLWQLANLKLRVGRKDGVQDLLGLLDLRSEAVQDEPDSFDPDSWMDQFIVDDWMVPDPCVNLPELDPLPLSPPVAPLLWEPGLDPYVVSAIRLLKLLAPERLPEGLQKACVRRLAETGRKRLLGEVPAPVSPIQDPVQLLSQQHWQEVIDLLPEASLVKLSDRFHLALAYWGKGNEAKATELCQKYRQIIQEDQGKFTQLLKQLTPTITGLAVAQHLWLSFWRAGDTPTAKTCFERLEELAQKFEGDQVFSYWHLRKVTYARFKEDFADERGMLRGVAILPPFLRKLPGEN